MKPEAVQWLADWVGLESPEFNELIYVEGLLQGAPRGAHAPLFLDALPLTDLVLADADLTDLNLTNANLSRSSFDSARFYRVSLSRADTEESSFVGAELREFSYGGHMAATDLSGIVMTGGYLSGMYDHCAFDGAVMSGGARFEVAQLLACALRDARLTGSAFYDVKFVPVKIKATAAAPVQAPDGRTVTRGTVTVLTPLAGTRFETCSFNDVNFSGADLSGAVFDRCDLQLLQLDKVKGVEFAEFIGCDMAAAVTPLGVVPPGHVQLEDGMLMPTWWWE